VSLYNGASGSNFREYANNGRFDISTSHTLSIWVQPQITPVAQWAFIARGVGTVSGDFTVGTPSASAFNLVRAQVITGSGSQVVATTAQWTNKNWIHVCQVYDGAALAMRVYIDGRQQASSSPVGTFSQTTTSNIRLWMRTDATIATTDCWLEQFGWWRTCLRPDEIDALARGADFTKIRRDDALLLDPLNDLNGVDLVAGLGVNTGTLSIRERAPIIRTVPNVTLAKPRLMRAMTRKNYLFAPVTGFDTRTMAVPFLLRGPGKPMPILGPSAKPLTWTSPTGGDVTVALTGSAATTAAGSVTIAIDVPATGQASTAAAGTVIPSTAVPVSGVGATVSAGTVVPAIDVALTGAAATTAAGNVGSQILLSDSRTAAVPFILRGPGRPQAIGGRPRFPLNWAATVAAGSDVTVALSGQAATASAGSVTPSTDVPAVGSNATAGVGSVALAMALALTGNAASALAGTLQFGTAVAVSGAAATAAAGSIVPSLAVALSGVGLTASPGIVTTSGGVTPGPTNNRFCPLSAVLTQIDARLAAVMSASSTDGGLRSGCRFTLDKEPLSKMDGDYFTDVEAITPVMRNRAIGEAYWEATIVIRVAYQRGGGDAGGGDRQSVMRDALGDGQRFSDVLERPDSYAWPTSGISEVRYQGCTRAATFRRGEIWETRFLVRWRSDSFTA